ncbi:hypothetical protein [Actinoplanes sp. HUAS TT8]|uniref:hypothetical protein n=1 Tax=Actinoplanes sp. HUAS TT8 TaxID=3447453 RepID=UPI003F51C175
MLRVSELNAALKAQGIDADVLVDLDGIPLAIRGVRLDERRGVILLELCRAESRAGLRQFVGRADAAIHAAGGRPEHAVRHNARGHYELLRSGEPE